MILKVQKCISIVIILLLLFIQNTMASDCDILSKAITVLNCESLIKDFSNVADCCIHNGVTCDENKQITEIKLSKIHDLKLQLNSFIIELANLKQLTSLELDGISVLKVQSIPSEIENLKSLKTLVIRNSSLVFSETSIPDNIGNLSNLEKLDLSNNLLKGDIPKSIANLKHLKYLNLSDNSLSGYIPYEFKELKELEQLQLDGNYFLNGYVPLIPKLVSCGYKLTNLCLVKGTVCKSDLHNCSEEEVRNTNNSNGNPNPSSNEYEVIKKESFISFYLKIALFVVLAIIIITIIVYCCIFVCFAGLFKASKKLDHQGLSISNYSDYVYNNSAVTPTNSAIPYPPTSDENSSSPVNKITPTVSVVPNVPAPVYNPPNLPYNYQSLPMNNYMDYNQNEPALQVPNAPYAPYAPPQSSINEVNPQPQAPYGMAAPSAPYGY